MPNQHKTADFLGAASFGKEGAVGSNPTHGILLIFVYEQSVPLSLGLGEKFL